MRLIIPRLLALFGSVALTMLRVPVGAALADEVAGADRMIDPAEERFMAGRACATIVEYPTASHLRGITVKAAEFTRLIKQAAETTVENE